MKSKLLAVCLALTVVVASNDAFASRARLSVLGDQDAAGVLGRGSFYYNDAHNIFYNPSYVNDFTNWASIEKANGANGAEGGTVTNMGSFNLGIYLNRGGAINGTYNNVFGGTGLGAAGSTAGTLNSSMRPIDVMFGGDMGMKWGFGLTYGSFKELNTGTSKAKDVTLHAGVQAGDFHPWARFKVMGKNEQSGPGVAKFEDKTNDMAFGLRYNFGEWVPFAAFATDKTKFGATGAATTEDKNTAFGGGFGRSTKLTDVTSLHYGLSYWRKTDETKGTAPTKTTTNIIPVDIAAEAELASWLAARAGLQYDLWNTVDGNSAASTTTGRLGASFKADKFAFDWAVGNTQGADAEAIDSNTFSVADGFFTQASVTYAW